MTESIFYFHKESRDFIRDLIQSEMKKTWNEEGKDVNALLGKANKWWRNFMY